ncbi:uncharacterized protein LOC118509755 isoform X2 [Anopheles stephensi]|uniref:uncharacterized protein LOC118509755 isoform X2 n=1 Tax=Anopheles stephensi TaxID=30069 RepID=UPI001658BBE9|nr:uncharacterized protein LOC118509755 isoform X2 [Anopheles stephensi]
MYGVTTATELVVYCVLSSTLSIKILFQKKVYLKSFVLHNKTISVKMKKLPPPKRPPRIPPKRDSEQEQLIKSLEQKLQKHTPSDPIDLDMTHIIPRRLYNRLRRMVKLPPYDDREFEGILAVRLQDPPGSSDGERRSTDDEDDRTLERAGDGEGRDEQPFELIVEERSAARSRIIPTDTQSNWMEAYLRKTGNERIQWQTKYYRTDQKLLDKPLFQQIEELIDLGAQDFSEWLNGLGAEKSNITKDIIKQLFSIEIEDEMARALRVDTREIRAIPTDAARHWNLEHMALQNRIAQVMAADRRAMAKVRTQHVAFGRTLPAELRTTSRTDSTDTIEPEFPDDLRTLRALFQDIRHLRSVRYLIDHLRTRPDIQRPRYLLDAGLFRSGTGDRTTPFYQQVLPRKAILDSVRHKQH